MQSSQKVQFIPKDKKAMIPKKHSDGAAGYDLFTPVGDCILPNTTKIIRLEFSLKIPSNLLGYICGRSGLALKYGIGVKCSYVRDDQDLEVYLHNNSENKFKFEQGDRIAQLVFLKLTEPKIIE